MSKKCMKKMVLNYLIVTRALEKKMRDKKLKLQEHKNKRNVSRTHKI